MKKFLPRTSNTTKGFTLIEILVVVAIIAILSVIAVSLYTNVQMDARDGKRKAELGAIVNVLEVNKTSTGYQPVTAGLFGGGVYPGPVGTTRANDPSGFPYCIGLGTAADPAASGFTTSACPTGFAIITGTTVPAADTATYKLCARLESRGTASVTCRTNLQ